MTDPDLSRLTKELENTSRVLYIVGRWVTGENRAITREAAAALFSMWREAQKS